MTDDLVKRLRAAAQKRDEFEALMLASISADRIEALERERDEAYAKGYGDCENEINLTEIGKTNEFLHGQIAKYRDALAAMTKERDHWKNIAGQEGVCMTCRGPRGAPEPYGCFDCLNTGYCGEWHNETDNLKAHLAECEARLSKAVEALREIAAEASVTVKVAQGDGIDWRGMYEGWRKIATTRIDIARAVLTEIGGK